MAPRLPPRRLLPFLLLGALTSAREYSTEDMMQAQLALMAGRPSDCPPCFNCLLPAHSCTQYADCNESNGICDCPEGFGGDNCLEPLCASLGKIRRDRPMRKGSRCECDAGWDGINCNLCTTDQACNGLVAPAEGGVCYKGGEVINHNYQYCDVTNQQITKLLGDQKPQVTFTCKKKEASCDFQFWVDHRESFYCHLTECDSGAQFDEAKNSTWYDCKGIRCQCVPDRMLCGENGSVDITDFLDQEIRGPGRFECSQEAGGEHRCAFREPAMDQLITDLLGDSSIKLTCRAGECLYRTEVPGYRRPVKQINTPLIAAVIAACSLFVVAVIVATYYLSRRSSFRYGPIRLGDGSDSDDEQQKLMADHKPASLYFEQVTYSLNEHSRRILHGIHGVAHPAEVTAIMGASGAGKTTLLDILARKNKRGLVGGNFYVNGEKMADAEFRAAVGFVDQEDTMLPTLTVHETILNSALLRLPRDMTRAAKEQRVAEVERELGIHHIRDSLIGSEEDSKGRGISGGERRRVSIACELVTSPSVLFLDEPTSGLDAYNAYNVVECLVTLAKTYRRTVVFTIHQPRSNIVALFDRLILLARGRTVYSGPFTQCQSYFNHIGYSCPTGFNIADYLVDLTMHAGASAALAVDDGNSSLLDAGSFGPSSTRAVKSIASVAGSTGGGGGSGGDQDDGAEVSSSSRGVGSGRHSIRQRQERDLFSRRRNTADTTASSDAGGDDSAAYKLQQRNPAGGNGNGSGNGNGGLLTASPQNPLPLLLLDDSHNLPPPAEESSSGGSCGGTELDGLVQSFATSAIAEANRTETQAAVQAAIQANGHNAGSSVATGGGGVGGGYARVGYLTQFAILSQRTWKNLYRNPMLMLTHYAIAIVLAVLSGYLFYGLTDDIRGFQNRLGLFFFLLALFGFSTLTSLGVFAPERLLFVRERANGYYAPVTYFAAKVLFDILPLRVIPPVLMGSIVYPMTGLIPDSGHFARFILVLVLFNLAAAAICLFVGIVCRDGGVANLIGSLVMLFSLLFAGLLLNHDAIPHAALWLQSLSIFHYGFEALIVNEVLQLTLVDKKYGLDITIPGATILSTFGFNNAALWSDVAHLAAFAALFIVLAYGAMHVLLVEKR